MLGEVGLTQVGSCQPVPLYRPPRSLDCVKQPLFCNGFPILTRSIRHALSGPLDDLLRTRAL